MNRISLVGDRSTADAVGRTLVGIFNVRHISVDQIDQHTPEQFTVVDLRLSDTDRVLPVKEWLKRKPKSGKAIFVVDPASRIDITRAYSIGATDVMTRPIDVGELLAKIGGEVSVSPKERFANLAGDRSVFAAKNVPGVSAAMDSLQSIFSSASQDQLVSPAVISAAGEAVVGEIESQGLASWLDTVRKHHSQTYQHCLLVTGVAVGFGQHIGVSRADRQRLSFAGMLHDVGKAKIPLAILEKPGALDNDEKVLMRQHPQLGVDALGTDCGLEPAMIDMVLHHHELLDGSGYPHGIAGKEICDLVRIMTISDIFGALIERRSYKPPLTNDAAYQILLDMGPKLDKDLVREFRFVSQLDHRQ